MRTQEEIVQIVRADDDDIFGFAKSILVPYLDFEHAREFLKPDVTAEQWKQLPQDRQKILANIREYMEFAWGKVEDHRGLSAGRSVDKLTAWAWLLDDDVAKRMNEADYAQYGAPKLAIACKAFELPIPDSDEIRNMIAGRPCVDSCELGCDA